MTDDRGPLDLTKRIEELLKDIEYLKNDNLILAKEVDRLNEYVQIMELEKNGKK
tara:strand:- start:340 stop:501 length:162 start_codon:yes stop_codon:yes gene_type:complete